MQRYDFKCKNGHTRECRFPIAEHLPPTVVYCPFCDDGTPMKRVYHPVGFKMKIRNWGKD